MMSDYNPHLAELRVVRLGQRQLRDDGAGQVRGDALHLAPAQRTARGRLQACKLELKTKVRKDSKSRSSVMISVLASQHIYLLIMFRCPLNIVS